MKMRVVVEVDGFAFRGGAQAEVPEVFHIAFQPEVSSETRVLLEAIDYPALTESVPERPQVTKLREDAAEILSAEITRLLLREMHRSEARFKEQGYGIKLGPI